jgi:hypothetical protein
MAGVDWALSAKPTYLRVGTAIAAALIGDSIAFSCGEASESYFQP